MVKSFNIKNESPLSSSRLRRLEERPLKPEANVWPVSEDNRYTSGQPASDCRISVLPEDGGETSNIQSGSPPPRCAT